MIMLRPDGRNWIALFNARRSPSASHFGVAIGPVLQEAIDEIDEWPNIDLFEKFPPQGEAK